MNAHVRIELEEIAFSAGAVVPCSVCGNYHVYAEDDAADSRAYAMATNAWRSGQFRSTTRPEVMAAMKAVLDNANGACPSCGQVGLA